LGAAVPANHQTFILVVATHTQPHLSHHAIVSNDEINLSPLTTKKKSDETVSKSVRLLANNSRRKRTGQKRKVQFGSMTSHAA
jgi:hypothetical protein